MRRRPLHRPIRPPGTIRRGPPPTLLSHQSAPPEQFAEALRQLYSDPLLRQIMRDALADLPHPDATQALADLLLAAAE